MQSKTEEIKKRIKIEGFEKVAMDISDSESALKIIDEGLEKDDSSLLVRLIRLKLLFSNENSNSNDVSIKNELDSLIKDLVKNIDYQVYKNTSTDKDALWLYSMSNKKEEQ